MTWWVENSVGLWAGTGKHWQKSNAREYKGILVHVGKSFFCVEQLDQYKEEEKGDDSNGIYIKCRIKSA